MEAVLLVIVTREQLVERERISKLVHAALGPIKLNSAGHLRVQYHLTLSPCKPRYGIAAALIIGDTPAGAEVLQVGVYLSAIRHGCCPDHSFNGAALLDSEDAGTLKVAIRRMLACLHEDYLITVLFDRKGDKATAFLAIGTIIINAIEMVVAGHAGNVVLKREKCQHARRNTRKTASLTLALTKPPISSRLLRTSS